LPAKTEAEFRAALKAWIVKKNGKVKAEDVKDDSPLIAGGILKSLQVMELILWIEDAAQVAVDVENLKPGVFRSIDTITAEFVGGAGRAAPAV